MDRMSAEILASLDSGVRVQVNKERPIEDKAQEKIYVNKEGVIGLPSEMLSAALVNAGRSVKMGKKQISTATTTSLYDHMQLQTRFMVLQQSADDDSSPAWEPDTRRGVSNQSKSPVAVCIVRPRFDQWACFVEIVYNDKSMSRDTAIKLFKEAGSSQGLGSFRPNRKGPFGMFRVAKWEETTLASTSEELVITVDGKAPEPETIVAAEPKARSRKKVAAPETAAESTAETTAAAQEGGASSDEVVDLDKDKAPATVGAQ